MKCFYQNLDLNNFLDNKKFWKNIKPFFSEKGPRNKKVSLVVGEKIISEDNEVSEALPLWSLNKGNTGMLMFFWKWQGLYLLSGLTSFTDHFTFG